MEKQDRKPLTYLAYLLRLWREGGTAPWRVTLEDPHTGRRHAFADLKGLFTFLGAETGADWEQDGQQDHNGG